MSKQELATINKLINTLLIITIITLIGGFVAGYFAHKCDDILKTILLNRAFTLGVDITLVCALISGALLLLRIRMTKDVQTKR